MWEEGKIPQTEFARKGKSGVKKYTKSGEVKASKENNSFSNQAYQMDLAYPMLLKVCLKLKATRSKYFA